MHILTAVHTCSSRIQTQNDLNAKSDSLDETEALLQAKTKESESNARAIQELQNLLAAR